MLVSSSQFSRRGHSNIGCVIHAAALVATVAALVGALLGRPADTFWLHDRMLERVLESASNNQNAVRERKSQWPVIDRSKAAFQTPTV
jgi:hypothetical protein